MTVAPILPPNAQLPAPPASSDGLVGWARQITKAVGDLYSLLARRADSVLTHGLAAELPAPQGSRRLFVATDTGEGHYDAGVDVVLAAASHTHAEADVTNLVTDLAGKAAASHTHAEADVTNLVTDLAAKEAAANKNAANGYAGLDANGRVTRSRTVNASPGNGNAWGDIDSGIAGETVNPKDVVYLKAADARWWKAKADAATTSGPVEIAMVVVGGAAGAGITLLLSGMFEVTGWGLVVGTYWISSVTAGAIVNVPPGTGFIRRAVGHARSATVFRVRPSGDY